MAQYTALHLPGEVWLLRHQAEDALFRQVMPGYMWLVLLSLAGAAILSRGKARMFFAVATVFSLLQVIVTVGHEVPINRLVARWTPATLPNDWDAMRHQWMAGHWLRTGMSFVAFVLSAIGLPRAGE